MTAATFPQARIALGWAQVPGIEKQIPVYIDIEWMRALASIDNSTVTSVSLPVDTQTLLNAISNRAVFFQENDGANDDGFIPGPAGPSGAQGPPGATIFFSEDGEISDAYVTPVAINPGIMQTWTGNHVFAPSTGNTIVSTGNIGVQNATPTAPLHVGAAAGVVARDLVLFAGTVSPSASFGSILSVRDGTINSPANQNAATVFVSGTIVAAASGTHPLFAGLRIAAPTVTTGASAITEAATLYVAGAPAGAVANYAMHVATGESRFGGNLVCETAGFGIQIKEGANAKMGVATMVAGTITVSTTAVTANSRIFLTVQSLGTVAVATPVAVTARVAGTSFTITSSAATDTSVVAWHLIEPS